MNDWWCNNSKLDLCDFLDRHSKEFPHFTTAFYWCYWIWKYSQTLHVMSEWPPHLIGGLQTCCVACLPHQRHIHCRQQELLEIAMTFAITSVRFLCWSRIHFWTTEFNAVCVNCIQSGKPSTLLHKHKFGCNIYYLLDGTCDLKFAYRSILYVHKLVLPAHEIFVKWSSLCLCPPVMV